MKWTALALIAGFFIDLLLGDPRWLYHPVRIIGNSIAWLEKRLRRIFPKTPEGDEMGQCANWILSPEGWDFLCLWKHNVYCHMILLAKQ